MTTSKISAYLGIALGVAAAAFIGYMLSIDLTGKGQQTAPAKPAQSTQSQATSTALIASAVFNCPGGRSISADFYQNSVALKLSDGRTMTLPHAISADGARYANADESFVFWNKGKGAFIEENGTTTWDGCETK